MPPLEEIVPPPSDNLAVLTNDEKKNVTAESYLRADHRHACLGRRNRETCTSLGVCGICGELHETTSCRFFGRLEYVPDEPPLSRARQTLPKSLEITRMADGSTTVTTRRDFPQGTTFGPLQAKRVRTMNPMNDFPIKVFDDRASDARHLDRTDEDASNWMCLVAPASNASEQNLLCYQTATRTVEDIFYTAMRPIVSGEELRVWYAPRYAQRMRMPLYNTEFAVVPEATTMESDVASTLEEGRNDQPEVSSPGGNIEEIAQRLPAQQLGARGDKATWSCTICSVVMTSVIEYAKHLMQHYKPLAGVFCDVCDKKFHRLTVLQKHKRLKHPDEKSNVEAVGIPTSGSQQQQNAQTILMNMSDVEGQTSEAMKDIFEKFKAVSAATECSLSSLIDKSATSELLDEAHAINVGELLQSSDGLIENASLKAILENQCSSIGDSIVLSDNASTCAESVKFNVDEELASDLLEIQPEVNRTNLSPHDGFRCDICEKKFEKADYLYRHLRKHTGEFICHNCLGVFARKENLLSHLCPASSRSRNEHRKHECPYCQKHFLTKKYLKRHVTVRHNVSNVCKWCGTSFASGHELEAHNCQAPKHLCTHCGKRYVHREHLTRHVKLHANPRPAITARNRTRKRASIERPVICEKCGDLFKNPYSLKQHLRSHGERKFECDICHNKFHRIGVLQQHKSVHQSVQIPCQICGKKLKSKKALGVHVLLHGNRKFHCDRCDKSFFQRCNYLKHYKQMHSDKILQKCPHCPSEFTSEFSFNRHLESHAKPIEHPCKSCHKVFRREYQLKRHVQTNHSGIVFRCPYCKMTARYRHSMRRHFERQHKSRSDEWNRPGFVNDLIEKTAAPNEQDQNNSVVQIPCEETNTKKFPDADNPQSVAISMRHLAENRINEQAPIRENSPHDIETPLNEQEILLRVADIGESGTIIESDELGANEVPQLSISETEATLAEPVLGNAYIFGEDGGDIMFYVLENTPVIAEY